MVEVAQGVFLPNIFGFSLVATKRPPISCDRWPWLDFALAFIDIVLSGHIPNFALFIQGLLSKTQEKLGEILGISYDLLLSTSVAQQIEINNKLAGKLARDESATKIVSELKQGISEALPVQLEQNRSVHLVRKVCGLKMAKFKSWI